MEQLVTSGTAEHALQTRTIIQFVDWFLDAMPEEMEIARDGIADQKRHDAEGELTGSPYMEPDSDTDVSVQ